MRGLIAITAATLAAASWVTGVRGAELGLGQPAPRIDVAEWVKGGPIEAFEPGKTYVVEFWATWCRPCVVSIPHLTALQKQYEGKGVEVIGVSVHEHDVARVGPFVERMGEQMGYNVAVDRVSSVSGQGVMATNWMRAAGQDLLPVAFLIHDQTIQWIGPPLAIDRPLARVVAGTYDLDEAIERDRAKRELDRKAAALEDRLRRLRPENYGGALLMIDRAIEQDPTLAERFWLPKFELLILSGNRPKAASYGKELVEGLLKDDPERLGDFARLLVDPNERFGLGETGVRLALSAAERARAQADQVDPHLLDTLARARFLAGNLAGAVAAQHEAVTLDGGRTPAYKERLASYAKALDRKAP